MIPTLTTTTRFGRDAARWQVDTSIVRPSQLRQLQWTCVVAFVIAAGCSGPDQFSVEVESPASAIGDVDESTVKFGVKWDLQ